VPLPAVKSPPWHLQGEGAGERGGGGGGEEGAGGDVSWGLLLLVGKWDEKWPLGFKTWLLLVHWPGGELLSSQSGKLQGGSGMEGAAL
jgi:hypothetical protein